MNSHKIAARTFGIFFILAFLSYGIGSGLIDSIIKNPDFLSHVYTNKSKIVVGVVLMALIHSFVNIGLPVIVFPILKPYNEYLAIGFLSAAILATTILAVGTVFLLLLLPLSEEYAKSGAALTPNIEAMGILLKKAGFYSYHMGMALWSIGGLMFVSVLYKSKLIPRLMSVWGIVGYIFLLLGSIILLSEHNEIIEIASVVPGGLFEVALGIWLIVKGFNSSAIDAEFA